MPEPGAVLHRGEFSAASVPAPVEYRVITPPGWDGTAALPLLLVLHGANSSAAILDSQVELYGGLWAAGDFPEVAVACASTPTMGGFYVDQPGPGPRWETLVARDFPRYLADRFQVDLRAVLLAGASMGGYGALKIAFRDPGRFVAVAAMEPTVFPGENLADAGPRNTLSILAQLRAAMASGTGDEAAYARDHVVTRLRDNADAVRRSGLAILVECGDNDSFCLQDGAEYLHRVLWELDLSHEYRLVRGADHVGPPSAARERQVRAFLAAALAEHRAREAGEDAEPPAVAAFRAWLAGGAEGPAPEVDFGSPAGPAVLRLMLEPERHAAAARDATVARRFGELRCP